MKYGAKTDSTCVVKNKAVSVIVPTLMGLNINANDKIYWFHCASLGEFEQGRPVIELFKKEHSDCKILLTFYSPSGYEIRKNYEYADYVYYLPLDTPLNAKKFLHIVNPKVVFFIKYEFWYFFLKEIGKRDIPLYLVSGIFRKSQRFFKPNGIKSRKMLRWFTHFFVQNEESAELLRSIRIPNVTVTGDTRFDRVHQIAQQSKDLPLIERFSANKPVLVAGSTWKPDEEIIIEYFNSTPNQLKVIVAPHEIHNENIQRIIRTVSRDKKSLKYSEANESNIEKADLLIIDSIGTLSSVYKYGKFAYIGGGFGKGIHNILEAATFGLPVIFGPNYKKFKEAVDLINRKAAFMINDLNELASTLNSLIHDENMINESGKTAATYVEKNRGAARQILKKVLNDKS